MSAEKPRATKQGFHYNGWGVSWYVIGTAVLVIGNAFVAQYRIDELEKRLGTVAERARQVEVIDNRIKHNTDTIRWHRLREHSTHGTAPDIDQ